MTVKTEGPPKDFSDVKDTILKGKDHLPIKPDMEKTLYRLTQICSQLHRMDNI